jgi:hypothetical protein
MNRKFLVSVGALVLTAWCVASPLRAQNTASGAAHAPASIFHVVPTPNENPDNFLSAASASSPNDIWAVGESTIHFDGTKWTAFPAPMILGDNTGDLQGVVDISPTSAWAVGNLGNGNSTQVIEQWNGTQWNVFPGPTFAPHDEPLLFAATATSANDVWAVGALGSPMLTSLSYSSSILTAPVGPPPPRPIPIPRFSSEPRPMPPTTYGRWAIPDSWVAPPKASSSISTGPIGKVY